MSGRYAQDKRDMGIIFDGDDTLWDTQSLYEKAKERFVELLNEQGFVTKNAIALLDFIDSEAVSEYGFVRERFPLSMCKAYEELCRTQQHLEDNGLRAKLYAVGDSVFDQEPEMFEDAERVLSMLRPHYVLNLATKGDRAIQESRVKRSGLAEYFDSIDILPEKTEVEYSKILQDLELPTEKVWVVGNSAKSDVNPAVKLGLRAILIPRGSWRYEESTLEDGDVFMAHSLSEAQSYIAQRDGIILSVSSE